MKFMTSWFSLLVRRRGHVALWGIVLLGAILRVWAIGAKSVWLDEAFSIWVANQGVVAGWNWLIKIDQHPPLYYSLLSIWQSMVGDQQGAVRGLSALGGTAAIPFVWAATKRLTRDEISALLAALILALSPFHVRYAQEARMYALLSLLAAAAIFCAIRYLTGYGTRRLQLRDYLLPWRWQRLHDVRIAVGLSVSQAALMLTHNTATVFFPLALNLVVVGAWLVRRQTGRHVSMRAVNAARFGRNWLLIQGVAFVLWLPWAVPFVLQSVKVDREFWIAPPTLRAVMAVVKVFNFAHLPDWMPAVPWMVVYSLLAVAGLYFLRKQKAWALLLISLTLVPFGGELLVSLRRPIFYDRTLIWASLSYYMLIAMGIRGLMVGSFSPQRSDPLAARTHVRSRPWWYRVRLSVAALAVLMIVSLSALSLANYYGAFEKEDWAKAADYVAARIQPDDLILFNATWVQIPFDYYFRHAESDATLHGVPVDLFDAGVLEPKMTQADIPRLQELIQDQPRVWLVYSHDWYTDPDGIIPRELGAHLHLADRQRMVGLQLYLFTR